MFCNFSNVHSPFILFKLSRSVAFYIKTKARQSVSGTQFTVRYMQFKGELHSRTQFAIQKFMFHIWWLKCSGSSSSKAPLRGHL